MKENNLKEKIIEYWNQQPCFSRRSEHDPITDEYFEHTEKIRKMVYDPYGLEEKFINSENRKDQRVLEIGCGIGMDAANYFVKRQADYTGIDISKNSIEIAKKRLARISKKEHVFVGDAADQNFLSQFNQFDLVYSLGVLHHCPDLEKIIENVDKILNDNGEFLFMVYAKDSYKHALVKEGLSQYESQDNCPYVQVYSLDEIKNFLLPYFEIVDHYRGGLFMYNEEEYKKNNLVLEPWFEKMDEKVRFAMDKNLGECFYIKAKKIK